MIDVTHQINAVRRRVGTRVLEAGKASTVIVSQTYDATVEDVWDACTDPERIPRWFLPVSGDLRLGGRYQLEGNAGGTIEECDPPNGFRATWEYGGGVSWIELRLSPADGDGTLFELEHIGRADDAHYAEFGPAAVGIGWDLAIAAGLTVHLRSGASVDPAEAAAWTASDDGRRFVTLSGEAWCAAHVAAGADEAEAKAAADRAIAAYTAT